LNYNKKMPYIELGGTGDRLGANISEFVGQIIYAHKNKFQIRYDRNCISSLDGTSSFNKKLYNSIFIETLLDYIDIYNSGINSEIIVDDIRINLRQSTYYELISQVVINVGMDYVTYFKLHIYDDVINIFKQKCIERGYTIPFDIENTVVIHLRLDDVVGRSDYDGRICSTIFGDYMNKGLMPNQELDNFVRNTYGHQYNSQSPIPYSRIKQLISNIKSEFPNSQFVFVTSPGENISKNITYPVISNNDESYDAFLLCSAKKLVLSRSTFSMISFYFNDPDIYYVPLWGHASCFGLNTKFDNNKNIKYFY